jgi:Galactose oxidase, central domain
LTAYFPAPYKAWHKCLINTTFTQCRDKFFADIHRFDAVRQRWDTDFRAPVSFCPRAYHTATLVGGCIWVVGGSTDADVFQDVHCFELDTLEWREVTVT